MLYSGQNRLSYFAIKDKIEETKFEWAYQVKAILDSTEPDINWLIYFGIRLNFQLRPTEPASQLH